MAQNAPKPPKSHTTKSSKSTTHQQRKQSGARVIKPKKTALQKQQAMKKKHTAGLTALTERSLAGKAGHLEMLGGGKREKKVGGEKGQGMAQGAKKGDGLKKG